MVVNLSEVTDVGPGLLGVLLRVRRGVTRVGGTLALVVAGPPGSDLVETTLLATLIQVAGDRTEALALVGAGAEREPAGVGRPVPNLRLRERRSAVQAAAMLRLVGGELGSEQRGESR